MDIAIEARIERSPTDSGMCLILPSASWGPHGTNGGYQSRHHGICSVMLCSAVVAWG